METKAFDKKNIKLRMCSNDEKQV